MKTKLRNSLFVVLSLLGFVAAFLFGPSLLHRALLATTDATDLQQRKSKWTRIVQIEPQALNGPNRETFHRYSSEAFRWFRVRGMIDPACEDTSPTQEWHELVVYFTGGRDAARPPELARAQ